MGNGVIWGSKEMIITFEGIDGSGKTTLATKLYSVLKNKKLNVYYYKEELVDTFSLSIRKLIESDSCDEETRTFLFFALRSNILSKYFSHHTPDDILLVDRFVDSTVVYDSLLNNMPLEIVTTVNNYLLQKYNTSVDYTVIVDCSIDVAIERIKQKSEKFLYDNVGSEKLHQIRHYFLKLPELFPDRRYIILENGTEEQLSENIVTLVKLVTGKQN